LYQCDLKTEQWKKVALGHHPEKTKQILQTDDHLLVFTESNVYRSNFSAHVFEFNQASLERTEKQRRVSFIDLFFHLHDGDVFGLSGRLLWDVVGIILFFLSISAFYAWIYPKRKRRRKQNGYIRKGKIQALMFRLIVRYHIKLGIWVAVILLIIAGTGLFMRPPLIVAIAEGDIPAEYYPGILPDNPWEEKIHNALYDAKRDIIVIAASDGLWQGPADLSKPFKKVSLNVPIFVMGPQVFQYDIHQDRYLVGSFSGMFAYHPQNDQSINLITGRPAENYSTVRPADYMVTGYFETPNGQAFITSHEQGLTGLNGAKRDGRFQLPATMNELHSLSLWNFMFELHNGRIFKDFIGSWYILIAPLGSMLFLLIVLSGIWDWLYLKRCKHSKNQQTSSTMVRRRFKKAI
jgi:hypothetical protein